MYVFYLGKKLNKTNLNDIENTENLYSLIEYLLSSTYILLIVFKYESWIFMNE